MGLVLQDHDLAKGISSFLRRWSNLGHPVMRITTGAFLLSSGLTGTYFAPQLGIQVGSLSPVSILEIISGVSILIGAFTRAGTLLFSVLFFYTFVPFGIFGLDQLYLLGIAVYLFVMGGGHFSVDKILGRVRSFPVIPSIKDVPIHTILRTLLGLNLIWLGLTEKLLQPQLTAAAIVKFGVPYYPELELFVFLFGFFEIYLGFHLVLGLFVRLTSLVYIGLLISAVKLFGETVNHLPLFGVSVFLVLLGAGEYYTTVRLRSVRKDSAAEI
ncbi:MAG: DoxX family membrane protein [Thaumarchaeota archaeon]|nr:DoxX family membrane protein [Nitrososphaerota archaeon]